MLFTQTALAVFGLTSLTKAHMIMSKPVPFGKSTLDNSPLKGSTDVSNFPCKQRTGVYAAEGASNTMPLGSVQELAFTGEAVHGGGSCQISVTYDLAPTASSVWKVIHSIEGGCPAKNTDGNLGDTAGAADPFTYSFTMPTTMPTGTAVLAWTWFNKVGNREMYMNCAPISITAAASKRSDEEELMRRNYTQLVERDTAAYNALPNMFVANIPDTTCKTDNGDLKFPNPGSSLEKFGTSALVDPIGAACGAVVSASPASGATTAASSAAAAKTTLITSRASASTPAASLGGVFVTQATTVASVAPVASSPPASSAAAPKATPVASSAAPAGTGTSSPNSTTSGGMIAPGTKCPTEGMWNCIGGTSFQECASGAWSVVMAVAAGTHCTGGQSMSLGITAVGSKAKRTNRETRFSNAHVRRHLHHS